MRGKRSDKRHSDAICLRHCIAIDKGGRIGRRMNRLENAGCKPGLQAGLLASVDQQPELVRLHRGHRGHRHCRDAAC